MTAFISSVRSTHLAFTVDNMVHECLIWQVSLFGWHFQWIQHLLISLTFPHLAYNSSQFYVFPNVCRQEFRLWDSSSIFLPFFNGSKSPTTFFGGLHSNIDATSAESSDRAALMIRPVPCLIHFVFICSLKQVIIWDVPIQPVTLVFFPALGSPVLLHWIRLTLELGARGISAALKLTSEICRHRRDKGTLKYAFLSQPWYLWHQHSNPLPQTPTLEGICGCLINTNRNKAWSLCPHLLYVFPAIK